MAGAVAWRSGHNSTHFVKQSWARMSRRGAWQEPDKAGGDLLPWNLDEGGV